MTPGLTVGAALPGTEAHYAFVVAAENEALLAALDRVLAELETDGTIPRLVQEWHVAPGSA